MCPGALRILIADDNAAMRTILRQVVEMVPEWTVCGEAVDGRHAVTKAVELNPDLLLLDISMPHLGGWQACRLIREKVPQIKILMITEHDPSVVKAGMAGAPIDGFVIKSEMIT